LDHSTTTPTTPPSLPPPPPPLLHHFRRGGEPIDYQGERNAKGLQAWVTSKTEPAVVALETKESVDKFNERLTVARVIIFEENDESETLKTFTEVASSPLSTEFSFGRVSSAALAEELGQKMGSIVLFYKHQVPVVYGEEGASAEAFKAYLKNKGYPRLETLILNQSFINRVTAAKRTMMIAFHENADQLELVREIARKLPDEVHSSETPVAAYPELAGQWGASGTKYPTFVVATWEDDHPIFKAFNEEDELTVDSAVKFVLDCIDGTCSPYKKSQPLPEADSEEAKAAVQTLVYKNFDSIVMDTTKDVLVEFYAPWCGHCKALAPLYEEIASVFKPQESLVIAKFDATANYFDPAFDIKGFPTLLFFTANDKANPLRYEGKRDFPSIATWIKEHASVTIDPELIAKATTPEDEPEIINLKEEL
jgi:protein disulfide-isomerase A1